MLKKKKKPFTALLLIIYALLIYQEIIVCQLLCCKSNGTQDIELAIFSFQCECKFNYRHTEFTSPYCPNENLVSRGINGCYDLLLESSWPKRNINPPKPGVDFITQYHLNFPIEFRLNEPFRCLLETVPLSKFLYLPFLPLNSVVQRC
jgi:hypothetical protein